MSEVVAKVVAKRCLAKKLSKFLKTHRETPALQSLPNKVIGLQAVRLASLLNMRLRYWCVRTSHLHKFYKIGVLKKFTKLTGKYLCWSLFINKVTNFQPTILLKKRVGHRCFSVSFVKFLKIPF